MSAPFALLLTTILSYLIVCLIFLISYKCLIFRNRNKKNPRVYLFKDLINQYERGLVLSMSLVPYLGICILISLFLHLFSEYKIYTIWHDSATIAGNKQAKKSIAEMKAQQVNNILNQDK